MNTESNRLMELYIRKVLREVQAGKPTKNKIRAQLEDHILCAVEDSHLPPEKAVKQAVKALGDPIAIGKEYNRTYAIHMGFADWARLIGPWLVAPTFALGLILDAPLMWSNLVQVALYSIITGAFFGQRFSKKTLCIYSCLLPPIAMVIWFAASIHINMVELAAYEPSLQEITADMFFRYRYFLITIPLWMIGFTLSCLWRYGEIAFTERRRKDFQYCTFLILAVALCGFLGWSMNSSKDTGNLQRHAADRISARMREIVETEPENYTIALPKGDAEVYSEAITADYVYAYWAFFPGQFLRDIALFVDDYDEFRGGDKRDEYLADSEKYLFREQRVIFGINSKYYDEYFVDCSRLQDIDLETRQDIAAEAMLAVAEVFDDYGESNGFDLFPAMNRSELEELCLQLAEIEEAFYGRLREYEG